jgi:small subunit ribosomal protein S17
MAKSLTGVVASDKGNKTIVVTVQTRKTHPLYKKQYTVSKRFMAHDEKNEAQAGDKVLIAETRPISAQKRFRLEKIVERAGVEHVEAETPEVLAKTEEEK